MLKNVGDWGWFTRPIPSFGNGPNTSVRGSKRYSRTQLAAVGWYSTSRQKLSS